MSHPLRGYARAVQRALEKAGQEAPYQRVLQLVSRHFDECKTSGGKEAIVANLVERISKYEAP